MWKCSERNLSSYFEGKISFRLLQDARAFLEQLKWEASEADIEGMSLEDALCLTLLSGMRDARLKEKLSELETPTLPAFGVLTDAHLHSKMTARQTAAGNRIEGKNQQ